MSVPRRQKRYKLKSEINVVPYIDVMLVLLIIFMVTTPMLKSSVDVSLPQTDAKSLKDEKNPVIITVHSDGQLLLTLQSGRPESLDRDALVTKVGAFVRADPATNVLVAGDKNGKYQGVMEVLAALQQAGVSKVGLMSEPDQSAGSKHGSK